MPASLVSLARCSAFCDSNDNASKRVVINHVMNGRRRQFIRSNSLVTFSFGFNYRRPVRPGARARSGPHGYTVIAVHSADVRALPCRILWGAGKRAMFYDGAYVPSARLSAWDAWF